TSRCLRASSPLSAPTGCTGRPWRIASRASRLSRRSSTRSTFARPVIGKCLLDCAPVAVYPGSHDFQQLVEVDRLGDVVATAGLEAGLAVTGHRLRRQEHYL